MTECKHDDLSVTSVALDGYGGTAKCKGCGERVRYSIDPPHFFGEVPQVPQESAEDKLRRVREVYEMWNRTDPDPTRDQAWEALDEIHEIVWEP